MFWNVWRKACIFLTPRLCPIAHPRCLFLMQEDPVVFESYYYKMFVRNCLTKRSVTFLDLEASCGTNG